MGKTGYMLRMIDCCGKITGWEGKTNPEGRKELYKRLRPEDRIAIEACNLAFIMNKEFKKLTGTEFYILNPGKLYQIYMTDKKTDKEDALKLAKERKRLFKGTACSVSMGAREVQERRCAEGKISRPGAARAEQEKGNRCGCKKNGGAHVHSAEEQQQV